MGESLPLHLHSSPLLSIPKPLPSSNRHLLPRPAAASLLASCLLSGPLNPAPTRVRAAVLIVGTFCLKPSHRVFVYSTESLWLRFGTEDREKKRSHGVIQQMKYRLMPECRDGSPDEGRKSRLPLTWVQDGSGIREGEGFLEEDMPELSLKGHRHYQGRQERKCRWRELHGKGSEERKNVCLLDGPPAWRLQRAKPWGTRLDPEHSGSPGT